MGEIAEMMLDGTLCEGCGIFLNEDAPGFPCYCFSCRPSKAKSFGRKPAANKVTCPTCGKQVKTAGLADHLRDSHMPKPS